MTTSNKCPFCGEVHGDLCPEFVEEHLSDFETKTKTFVCPCGQNITATVPDAVFKDWFLIEDKGVISAKCSVCGKLERERLQNDVDDWLRRGKPRGSN